MKIIGLDVGTKRIGVAVADGTVRIAEPVGTLQNGERVFSEIAKLAREYDTTFFVVGLPRNNSGSETRQSAYTREFAAQIQDTIPAAKIRFQDESLTSVEAENRLKKSHRKYQKSDIDAEAATIILQDFLETFSNTVKKTSKKTASAKPKSIKPSRVADIPAIKKTQYKTLKKWLIGIAVIVVALGAGYLGFNFYYNANLRAPSDVNCEAEPDASECETVEFIVEDGAGLSTVAQTLASAGLIRSELMFRLYVNLNGHAADLKAGTYEFTKTLSVEEIVNQLLTGGIATNVFRITILPGSTVKDVKTQLLALGYEETEISEAFSKHYDHPVLADKPETNEYGAEPLEGYIFGDTYEFYIGESVENIITTTLDALWTVVSTNDLVNKFAEHGLNLYKGITLASIVQKEAGSLDQPTVAQIFYSRLSSGISLGSDVTLSYALDLIDPNREIYTNNANALDLDSPYNTRRNAGLTPGPISNPGLSALLAVANPSDTTYLYFLTGDDGVMYYSYTEEEHNANILEHCQTLCATAL